MKATRVDLKVERIKWAAGKLIAKPRNPWQVSGFPSSENKRRA